MSVTPPAAGRPASLSALFGVVFLDLLGFGILIPQLGVYAVRFHASALWVGLLVSVYSLMQFVAAPWLGRMSDARGRRPVLLLSLFGSFLGYVLFAVATSFPILFVSRIVDGVSGGNISTAQAYVADVTTPENRAKGMGIIGAGFGLGFVLGPALGGFLGAHGGNWAIGVFCAGLSALNFVLVWRFLPESRKPGTPPARQPLLSTAVFRMPGIGTLLVLFLIFTIGFSEMEGTFSVFLLTKYFHFGDGTDSLREVSLRSGYVFTAIGVVSALIQGGLIGTLRTRFGEEKLVLMGCLLTAAGLIALPFAPSFGWLFLPAMVMGAGSALNNPSLSSLVSQHAPHDRQGEVLGNYQAMGAIGRIAGPALGGLLFSSVSPSAPYLCAGVLIAGCALLSLKVQGGRLAQA